jgi:uncharacterized protein
MESAYGRFRHWSRGPSISFLFAVISLPALGQDLIPVPRLAAHVSDLTGTLSRTQVAQLEKKLTELEARKGSQIAVLVVPTTRPEDIEQYSIRVAEHWRLGRKGIDDGALLLVAMKDREMRIEVGYGLEGALPDVVAKRIIDDIIAPQFRAGEFYNGLDAGLAAMIRVIGGEPLPPPQHWRSSDLRRSLIMLSVLGLAMTALVVAVLWAMIGPLPAVALVGGTAAAIALSVLNLLIPSVVTGFIAFVITLFGMLLAVLVGGILRALSGWREAMAVVGVLTGVIASLVLNSLLGGAALGLFAAVLAVVGRTPRVDDLRNLELAGPGVGDHDSATSGGGSSSDLGGFSGGGGSFGGGGASGRW